MAAGKIPPLPPGFTLDASASMPALPPGFTLDTPEDTQQQGPPPATARDRVDAVATGLNSGLASVLGIPVDTVQNIIDLGKALSGFAYREATGKDIPDGLQVADRANLIGSSEWIRNQMGGAAENPRPDDTASRYLHAGGAGLPAAISRNPRAIISAVAGSEAAQLAADAGAGPIGQTAAALIGGLTPGAVESSVTGAGRLVANATRPLTRGGQQQMAADLLATNAQNPASAAANLRVAQSVVPGSVRTAGEASQDLGLLALEKGVRGRNPAAFAERIAEQNSARVAELDRLGGTPHSVESLKMQRNLATAPLRQQAFAQAGRAQPQPVVEVIDTILASPAGKRESVSSAMQWAKSRIGDETNPEALYEIRKDLQLAQRGKLQPKGDNAPNASTLAQARNQLGNVIDSLDDAIEASAPGFKAYLKRYADLSKPIDQAKVIQEIRRRAESTALDVTSGNNFLSSAQFSRAFDKALAKDNKLTPSQRRDLEAVRADLQLGQGINQLKAPGSDTFQNLSIAQAIGAGSAGHHPVTRVLTKPLQWVYKLAGSDERVNEILVDAMLDPKMSASLLERSTPVNIRRFSNVMKRRLAANGLGALIAAGTRDSETSEDRNKPER